MSNCKAKTNPEIQKRNSRVGYFHSANHCVNCTLRKDSMKIGLLGGSQDSESLSVVGIFYHLMVRTDRTHGVDPSRRSCTSGPMEATGYLKGCPPWPLQASHLQSIPSIFHTYSSNPTCSKSVQDVQGNAKQNIRLGHFRADSEILLTLALGTP